MQFANAIGLVATKPVFWVSDNLSPQLQILANRLKFHLVANLDMILSSKQITKALISLHGWASLSAPLLLANLKDKFSRVEAHM